METKSLPAQILGETAGKVRVGGVWYDSVEVVDCDALPPIVVPPTAHETLVAEIVAVGAFPQMAKRIAAMLIKGYVMTPTKAVR